MQKLEDLSLSSYTKLIALVYLKDNLKLLGYEPIIIEGKAYSLGDLHGSTGWNIMEKGMKLFFVSFILRRRSRAIITHLGWIEYTLKGDSGPVLL